MVVVPLICVILAGFLWQSKLHARQQTKLRQEQTELNRQLTIANGDLKREYAHALLREAQQAFQTGDLQRTRSSLNAIPASRRSMDDALLRSLAVDPLVEYVAQHDGPILDFLIDAERDLIVTSGLDGRLVVSSISRGEELQTLQRGAWSEEVLRFLLPMEFPEQRPPFEVYLDLEWLEPGKTFVGVTQSGRVMQWDLESGEAVELAQLDHELCAVAVAPENHAMLVAGSNGETTHLTDAGEAAEALSVGAEVTRLLRYDGVWIAGLASGELLIVSDDGREILDRRSESGPIWDLCREPNGNQLAIACGQPRIAIYEIAEGRFAARRELPPIHVSAQDTGEGMQSLAFADDGKLLWIVTGGYFVVGVDPNSGQVRHSGFVIGRDSMLQGFEETFPTAVNCIGRIATLSDGRILYTTPQGTVWRGSSSHCFQTLNLVPGSQIEFVPSRPSRLLELTPQGELCAWDLDAGARINTAWRIEEAHSLEISDQGLIAVASRNGEVAFATFDDRQLNPLARTYRHDRPIFRFALDPTGERVAVLDEQGVHIINSSGTVLATHDLSADAAAVCELEFDRTGEELIVFGPDQYCLVLSGRTAEALDRPSWLAHGAGAAVVRDPDIDGGFFVADAQKRFNLYPSHQLVGEIGSSQPIIGVFVVPGQLRPGKVARRLASCDASGNIRFLDPGAPFPTVSIASPLADGGNPATVVRLAPDCSRLCLLHADGALVVWSPQWIEATPLIPDRWTEAGQIEFDRPTAWSLRSVASLDESRLAILSAQPSDDPDFAEMLLTGYDFATGTVHSWPAPGVYVSGDKSSEALLAHMRHNMSLAVRNGRLVGCARHDSTAPFGAQGYTFDIPVDDIFRSEPPDISTRLVGEPINAWISPSLVNLANSSVVVHFAYGGMYCLAQELDADSPFQPLGRQGDGYSVEAAAHGKWIVAVGMQTRMNADSRLGYLMIDSLGEADEGARVLVDRRPMKKFVVRASDEELFLIYQVVGDQGEQTVIAELDIDSQGQPELSRNTCPIAEGRLVDARILDGGMLVILATRTKGRILEYGIYYQVDGSWRFERVCDGPDYGQAALVDAGSEGLAVLVQQDHQSLRILTRARPFQ